MARKPFFTDNMTVEQILNLSSEVINSMSTRDLSRAVRTVALAANKRIKRLLDNSVKRKTGNKNRPYRYQEKKTGKYAIATDALNYITKDGKLPPKFGVGRTGGTKGELHKELKRIKSFMDLETSTIKGAVNVRKEREKRIMGKTREEYIKEQLKRMKKASGIKRLSKKQRAKWERDIKDQYAKILSHSYEVFRKFIELKKVDPTIAYGLYQFGSESALELIAQRTIAGDDDDDIIEKLTQHYYNLYEQQQRDMEDDDTDVFNLKF